ncbi:2-amino-4-oxopentanoate thiolase subunit OrtB [Clostridium sp. CX1]|uniref:2-amino-4-oxopentanoate thiolase subunit OrtB n=1 Tax=Clostridium tanneri TaxID=3037988 RepID=A0ABU4JUN2_9CLOT|nr:MULTISPECIES: 2-amino-4-oxopentanoate thiolase subunit OrtB [unclassified Clostridium]MCT8976647.1 2-amino-4-oxopentanoate thiolase subunit OrtB [Clostridium sp. CX1]MDW8801860.1 2-amino-4-oxopentanoate thiolase subunit OrtB [Clostridium sp. A1-XYC3]
MTMDNSYEAVMSRNSEIMKKATGIDYSKYESGGIAFDYEGMMQDTGYSLEDIIKIQREVGVGNTPLLELKNLTSLARKTAPKGKGARIFVKDEQCNPSGSFKDRRASISAYQAKQLGFKGIAAATSGNYGAAVASQAAMRNLNCIIVQECFDSKKTGQPEILEKQRKCESLGAEVVQLSVGPELFYSYLRVLEETGYFNASLYSTYGIAGVESLGYEIAMQCRELLGRDPDYVIATQAGGGNLTGTARGLMKAGAVNTKIYGASVDLSGLHMASDKDFNRKSFTTGHTGFGVPYATNPDHSDVPRSAARTLRYMDEFLTVKQGEVFYITEALSVLEGMERGPAGNTSLTAAFALARELDENAVIVVQETEYTGAGKHPLAQLSFARSRGIEIKFGDPEEEKPGVNIILPQHPSFINTRFEDMSKLRKSYIKNAVKHVNASSANEKDISFLIEDTRSDRKFVIETLRELAVEIV